jgi:hypothetical protein
MATQKKSKQSSRIGAKGKRISRRREIQKWAGRMVTLIGVISPWAIFWMNGGK